LGGEGSATDLLSYLEDELKLIKTDELPDKVSFTLDPVAEYLAALYVVKNYQSDEKQWRKLIDRLRSKDTEIPLDVREASGGLDSIKGFLLALRDCCVTKGKENEVPRAVIESVSDLADKATIYELIAGLHGNADDVKLARQRLISFGAKAVPYIKKAAEGGDHQLRKVLDEISK